MEKISDRLYWIEDTCSTYVIASDDGAIVIDCGALSPQQVTQETGVGGLKQLYLTHFHRDQCSAAAQWSKEGIEVGLPFAEKRFFSEADLMRASYDTFDNYTAYYPGFSAIDDIDGQYVEDYARYVVSEYEFQVVPLPGHTFGSVGYLFDLDGQRYLACGDLLSAAGKVREYFWNQWRYMDFQGHVNLLESLEHAKGLGVDMLLPGHGAPFAATEEAFTALQRALEELYELFYAKPYVYYRPQFRPLSENVFEVTNSSANTYIVRDGTGHGLFIDCGYTSNAAIAANPHRFIDHLTPHLESELGISQVEWFLPTHYHDDHLAGLPALQLRYATKVATAPELQDIIAHPERYDMPCLVPHQTKVDLVVQRQQPFVWRGIEFTIEQFPGQTLYHNLITFTADGIKYLAIGDNISGLCFREQRDFIHSFIPKNRTPVSSYRDMPQQIKARAPDILLTGHGGGVDCQAEQVQRWEQWMERWSQLFEGIIDQPHANLGMDPHWVEFYPYKVRIEPGAAVDFEVRVLNHESETRRCALRFKATDGVQLSQEEVEIAVVPGVTECYKITARFPQQFITHSLTLTADVTWDGRHLGEIAEAIAYW